MPIAHLLRLVLGEMPMQLPLSWRENQTAWGPGICVESSKTTMLHLKPRWTQKPSICKSIGWSRVYHWKWERWNHQPVNQYVIFRKLPKSCCHGGRVHPTVVAPCDLSLNRSKNQAASPQETSWQGPGDSTRFPKFGSDPFGSKISGTWLLKLGILIGNLFHWWFQKSNVLGN